MATGDTFKVEAVISKWIDGEYGPYGFAEIDTPDSPAETALCSYKVKGLTPPLGEKFLCHIVPKGSKWRVSELLVQSLPAEVESIAGEIGDWRGKGKSKEWAIKARPLSTAAMPPFRIDLDCLWQVHIADIDKGTPIIFNAVRDGDGHHGYTATKLLYPTAARALGDGSPQTVITCVLKGWDTDSDAKGIGVAVRAPGACVAASVFVPAPLLRGAGLRRLKRAEKPTAPPPGDSDDLLNQWETMLRTGSEAERDGFAVDRLELELEWVESSRQWKVVRLIRPRAVRLPGKPKEVIDWVAGTVVSKPALLKDDPPEESPDTDDSHRHQDGEDEVASETTTDMRYKLVDVEYQDPRVGRGKASLRLRGYMIKNAGLALDVPVVIRLEAYGDSWKIRRLHRSTPLVRGVGK